MNTYRSKIGYWIIWPIAIIVAVLVLMIIQQVWIGVLIVACVMAFIIHTFLNTYYTINGNELVVRSGFMTNLTINIVTITRITKTNTILSSPALSMDRMEIFYNKYDSVVISPDDKSGFMEQLKMLNPAIIADI